MQSTNVNGECGTGQAENLEWGRWMGSQVFEIKALEENEGEGREGKENAAAERETYAEMRRDRRWE